MPMESIEELFEHELKDMLGAELSLLDALEQLASESSDREIKKAYTQHRKETQGQIKRLEKIFKALGQVADEVEDADETEEEEITSSRR